MSTDPPRAPLPSSRLVADFDDHPIADGEAACVCHEKRIRSAGNGTFRDDLSQRAV